MNYNLYGKNLSFDGLKFPWESAFVGVEQCEGNAEDHLQGDIALAFLKHWWADKEDPDWLTIGYPVIAGIAHFYCSRATLNADGTYSISRTMPPDEYHSNVTDSVYGNTVAKLSLEAAVALAPLVGAAPNKTFAEIASRLRILYDRELDYHPEFEGWRPAEAGTASRVKQADAVLLGYPLEVQMANSTRRQDLEIYSNATDPDGPAMTWSMYAIGYGDLGDDARSNLYFEKGYQEAQTGPFLLWHEQAASDGPTSQGAPNFITGAGGMMQALLAGYGGFRLHNGTLRLQRPRLPPNCTGFHLRKAWFRGNFINVDVGADGSWTASVDPATSDAAPTLAIAIASSAGNSDSFGSASAAGPAERLTHAPTRFRPGESALIIVDLEARR